MMDKIISILKYIVNVAKASLIRPFRKMFMEIRKKLMVKTAVGKFVRGFMTKVGAYLAGKPSSLKDYFGFKRYWIAKKLVLFIIIIIVCLPFAYSKWLKPYLMGKLWIPTFVINEDNFALYKGKAKLVTKGRYMIYNGDVEEGNCTGTGFLYDYDGNLVYMGEFLLNEYSGFGELYHKNGKLKYKGQFLANTYNGEGTLYSETGEIIYKGNFANGQYDGNGTLYADSGKVLYEGEFSKGRYHGNGMLYNDQGNLLYKGQFYQGVYEGQGELYYLNGVRAYSGQFHQGVYEGQGELYYLNGARAYSGQLFRGFFHGEGTIFTEEDKMKYKGNFKNGIFSGIGTLYSDMEKEIFTGYIKNDTIDYFAYLGETVDEIKKAFLAENEVIMGLVEFYQYYHDFGSIFTFSYAIEDEPPKLKSILFFEGNNPLNIDRDVSLEELEHSFGECTKQRYKSLTEKEFFVLSKIQKDPEQLYIRSFKLDDYELTLYYEEKSDSSYLFYEVGREVNENIPREAEEYIEEYTDEYDYSDFDIEYIDESDLD
ncbi:hypothetical protein [Defluviitalea saccharophila]|uniref:Toxin-antitoxin system YwqK family antitoxin n=1 Tax=Defluviitalea saccharophila TaxID=879970 RepID=A0ABZ2YAR0_9FIRM